MNSKKSINSYQEWREHWKLVFAASFGFSFFTIMMAAVGLFMTPLADDFGWSKTTLSAGPALGTLTTAILGPFLGMLIDRFGTRWIVLPGLVATTCSIAAFSFLTGVTWQWYLLWFVFGLVSVSIKSTAWTAAVVGTFNQSRGLALGITLSGTALAAMIVPPLVNWLIEDFGWRLSFVLLGTCWGGITFVLCILYLFDAHDRRRLSKTPHTKNAVALSDPTILGLTKKEGLMDPALWRLAISNFVVMLMSLGLSVHLFPILTEAGVERSDAAWLLSLAGFCGLIGKILTGYLLDKFRPNVVSGVTLGGAAIAFALLAQGLHSQTLITIAIIVNGYTFGTKTQVTGYLTASYGGMRNFGFLYGIMAALMALASGLGPLLAGFIYDSYSGYEPFLIIGAIGCAISGVLMISLPSYPSFQSIESKT